MNYDSLIFDMDGTLWDSREGVVASWNEVFAREGESLRITVRDMTRVMGMPMNRIAETLKPGIPYSASRELFEKAYRYENEYLAKHGGILYPQLEETLAELKKHYRLFIVSNCQTGYIEAMYEAHGLGQYFEDKACYGDNEEMKDVNIRLLMERNHLKKPAYIGDTAGDEEASRKAGVAFIHAAYGFGKATAPDAVIEKISDLLRIGR